MILIRFVTSAYSTQTFMNDAIFKFKRYEDASLSYTGIDKNADKAVGGWDTVLRREEYERLFYNQQETMKDTGSTDKEELPFAAAPASEPSASAPTAKHVLVVGTSGYKAPEVKKKEVPAPAKPQKIEAPAVNAGMVVMHKKFGKGTISSIDKAGKHLKVSFTEGGEKAFIYPDAFVQGFLTLDKGE